MRARLICTSDTCITLAAQRPVGSRQQETSLDSAPRFSQWILSSLAADDFELIRPHLRNADLVQEHVLVEFGDTLKRAYMPHKA